MYKNFNLTDEERKQIMEHHGRFGYKKPKTISEEIDTDDEERELSKLYDGDPEYDYDLDDESGEISTEFNDPDEFEDLHDLSVAKQNLPKERAAGIDRSIGDMDYKGAKHHNEIPGAQRDDLPWDHSFAKKEPSSDYFLKTYGTPDPDMESETLADRKKNAPLNFPKYTDKDRNDRENLLSWKEKKALIAQRAEKKAAREAAKEKRLAAASLKSNINESVIRLTESELIDLVKKIVKETTKK